MKSTPVVLLLTVGLLGACGSTAGGGGAGEAGVAGTSGSGGKPSGDAGPSDASGAPSCSAYPVAAAAGAGDEARARSTLATLDPTAKLSWSSERGTLSNVLGAVPLAGCTAGQEVHERVLALVGANSTLFNIDVTEWGREEDLLPCEFVTDVNRYVSFGRVRFGNHLSQSAGQLTVGVHATSGRVVIFRIDGDFTPATTPSLDAALGACEGAVASATDVLREAAQESFDYLFGMMCNLAGSGSYRPAMLDTMLLQDDPVLHEGRWMRLSASPELSYVRKAWLMIAPANYTSELVASNANCGGSIGFELTIDAVTARIISYVPGLGCTVC